jgi:hypothetical protein
MALFPVRVVAPPQILRVGASVLSKTAAVAQDDKVA